MRVPSWIVDPNSRPWDETRAPGRDATWRALRALRHRPPGRAARGRRPEVFSAALEQAQQLFNAATLVGYESKPILLFYG